MRGRSTAALASDAEELGAKRCFVDIDPDHPRDAVEVGIEGEQGSSSAPRHGGDHAVEHSSRGDPSVSAPAVDACRCVEIRRCIETEKLEAEQETTQIGLAPVAGCPGQHFRHDGLGDSERAASGDQCRKASVDCAPGGSVVYALAADARY